MNSFRAQKIFRFYVSLVTILTMLLSPIGQAVPVQAAPGDYEIYAGGLMGPFGMDFDASGNLYVAQENGQWGPSVARVAPDHNQETVVTGRYGASGLAFNSAGTMYLSDDLNEVTRMVSGSMEVVIPSTAGLGNPNAIAFDASDNLYVLSANGWLDIYTDQGVLVDDRVVEGLNIPQGIVINDAEQTAYISDAGGSITRLNLQTGVSTPWVQTNLGSNGGLAIDAQGNLYMSSTEGMVLRIDAATQAVTTCVDNIDFPRGLTFDSAGILYITDFYQGQVWKVEGCGVTLPDPPVNPQIAASVRSTWINLRNFTRNGLVSLALFEGETSLYSGQFTADDHGNLNFNRDEPAGMPRPEVGMTLEAQDVTTGITRRLDLVPLTVDGIDYSTRTIWGSGPANTAVQVYLNAFNNGQSYTANSDGAGDWSIVLPSEAVLIAGVHNVAAEVADLDNDILHADPYMPLLFAGMVDNWITFQFANPGAEVALAITSGGDTLFSGSFNADAEGNAYIDPVVHGVDLQPGMTITASDPSYPVSRSITLPNLALQSVDVGSNQVSGTADPDLPLVVQINSPWFGASLPVTAGQDGNWSLNLGDYFIVLDQSMDVKASYYTGDQSYVYTQVPGQPFIQASLTSNWIEGNNFPAGANVSVSLYDTENNLVFGPQDFSANVSGWFFLDEGNILQDLVAGYRITAEDAAHGISRELVLQHVLINTIDYGQDIVFGNAANGTTVDVGVAGPDSCQMSMSVVAGENDSWRANFGNEDCDLNEGDGIGASIADVDGDRSLAQPLPKMLIEASPSHGWVILHQFVPNSPIVMWIGEDGAADQYTGQVDEWGHLDFNREQLITPVTIGTLIQVDELATGRHREMRLANITLDEVDFALGTVSGTADPGATVHVEVGNHTGIFNRVLTADSEGNWTADFSTIGAPLTYDMFINAIVPTGMHTTSAQPVIPYMEIGVKYDWVNLRDFPADSPVTVTILPQGGGDPVFQQDFTTDGGGNAWIDNSSTNQVDLATGMTVRASEASQSIVKEFTIPEINITETDYDNDLVHGTGQPGLDLVVTMHAGDGGGVDNADASIDANGDWTADFGARSTDVQPGMWPGARYYDTDGDRVFVEPPTEPHIDMWLDANAVSAYDWPVGANLTLTISDGQGGSYTDSQVNGHADWPGGEGFASFDLGEAWTLQPGHQVSITDGTKERTSTAANLSEPVIDLTESTLSGTTDPGAEVWSNLCNNQGCANRNVIAGQDGSFEIDFDQPGANPGEEQTVTIQPGDGASINVGDGTGNNTSRNWHVFNPNITANAQSRWINAREWPNGATLYLTINGQQAGTAVMEQAPWNPGDPNDILANWDLQEDFYPGDTLVISDVGYGGGEGATLRTLVVSPIAVTSVNADANTISGTTTPGAWLQVCVNQPDGCVTRNVQAAQDGTWSVNVQDPGADPNDNGAVDLQPGMDGWAAEWDEDGDRTEVGWRILNPNVTANPLDRWINAREWPTGTTLYLTINGQPSGTEDVGPAEWNPDDIVAAWNLADPLQPGDTLVISDVGYGGGEGATLRTLVVSPIAVTAVDADANTISGTTTPGAWLQVCVNQQDGCVMRNVQAAQDGTWSVNVQDPGSDPNDNGAVDLQPGMNGWAADWDEDGDRTEVSWSILRPYIEASAFSNWINAREWPTGTTLYLTINGQQAGTAVMEQAPWNPGDPNDIVANWNPQDGFHPGDTLVISDVGYGGGEGATLRMLVVSPLEVTNIDLGNSTLTGVASPNAWLEVCANTLDGCVLRNVQADENGDWSAAFAAPGSHPNDSGTTTFALGVNGWAAENDGLGSKTWYDWSVPMPYIYADVKNHWVHSRNWALGTPVTLRINGVVAGTETVQQAPWNPGDPNDILAIFELPEETTMQIGDTVSVSNVDQSIVKELLLSSLDVTNINMAAASISGTATASAWVEVCVNTDQGCAMRHVLADPDGMWTADFAAPGTQEGDQYTLDEILPGMSGYAAEMDGDGDQTWQDWWLPNPHMDVWLDSNSVSAYEWEIGTELTLTVTQPAGGPYTATATSEPMDWDPSQGYYAFDLPEGYSLTPGQVVTIVGGGITRTHTIRNLSPVTVDAIHARLSGTAQEGAPMWANLCNADGCNSRNLTVGAGGAWVFDYSVPGSNEGEDYVVSSFTPGDGGGVNWQDEQGNNTSQGWSVAQYDLHVVPSNQELHGHGWPVGDVVTVTIDAPGGAQYEDSQTVVEDPQACGQPCFDMTGTGWTLEPGQTVTMSNGLVSKTVVVSNFAITDIDPLHDRISGVATPDSMVMVNIHSQDGLPRIVRTDSSGNWTADFSVPGDEDYEVVTDLTGGDSGRAIQLNPGDGDDGTLEYWATGPGFELIVQSNDENVPDGAIVATIQPTFSTPSSYNYTLMPGEGDDDNSAFTVIGYLVTINESPDYETQSTYHIRLRMTDMVTGQMEEMAYTLEINDLNETPSDISLSASSINENAAAGSTVGSFSAADQDASQTFTYTLAAGTGSADNAAFTISGNTLAINASPNFEAQPSYSIRVRVTDPGGLWYEEVFTITVSDLNETPTDISLSATSINENVAANTTVGTFSAADPDSGQTFTYTLVAGTGSTDNASFNISGGALRISASPNYEARSSYSVRIRATDQGGLWYEEAFTITVSNLNESPTDISLSATSIDENVAVNSTVGSFSAVDPDAAQTFTYTLVAGAGSTDNAAFNISGSTLRINASPDYETRPSYSIRVRVTDQGSQIYEESFTITINNIAENASDIELTATSINENVVANSTVGTLSAAGSGAGQTFNFSLAAGEGSADNTAFNISGSALRISASPNFETRSSYSIRVRATDSADASLFFEKIFTITVNDLNETPTDIVLSASSINENAAAGSTVGTFSAADPDAAQTFTYTLVAGTGSTDNAAFTITGNTLAINASPNFEAQPSYSIRVRLTDQGGLWREEAFTITVSNLNEAPTDIALSTSSINENVAANSTVGTLSVTDPDAAQTFTYTLVTGEGSADNAAFTIASGALRISASPNFEVRPSYSIRVRATDSGSPAQSYEEVFTITVNDLNETPTDITLSATSVNENAAGGSAVGTLGAADPDAAQTFTYTLVAGTGSADNAAFTITGGALTINASPNFEARSSYAIRVRVADQGGLWREEAFTITVNNLNETPTDISLSAASINENAADGSTVGTFSAADPDSGQAFTYALVAGAGDADNAAFTIVSGALRITAAPDYETKPSYSVRVRVTDSGTPALSYEEAFTITVNNLNDRPTSLSLSGSSVVENAAAEGRVIGDFSAADPDLPAQNFSYSLVYGSGSADNGAFSITGSTLRINAAPDYETKPSYSIRVRVTDDGAPAAFLERVFTITVTNQVEPPVVASFSKTGLQDSPITFTAADFSSRFFAVESTGTGILENVMITVLPAHGTLRVGSGPDLNAGDVVAAADLGSLVYNPTPDYSGADSFSWNGADSNGYAGSPAQVFLTIGFVARYGVQVSPAGDAKSVKPASSAVYTLTLTNTGNVSSGYTIALVGTPRWATTISPASVTGLAAGDLTTFTVSAAVPAGATGSDEAVVRITSTGDATKNVTVRLTTTAIAAPPAPLPVLLTVSPAAVNFSSLSGVRLTLSGANFADPMQVTIGGQVSPSVTRSNSGELLASLPAGIQPGSYDVEVCTTGTTPKCASLPASFTVLDNTPMVSAVYPKQGYNDAANTVVVQGFNLASAAFTLVDAAQQPVVVEAAAEQVTLRIPAGLPSGTYDLQACNLALCSTLVSAYTSLDVIKNDFSAADEDLWTSPATVREGNTILLGLNVHRLSGMGLAQAEVAFYAGDPSDPANKISPTLNPSTSMMAPGSVETVTAVWTPTGLTGAVRIYAVIDPDGLMTEATKANNTVSTTIQILPREELDETAPIITDLTVDSGAVFTADRGVSLSLSAVDNTNGTGVQTMNIVEREYNTSARQWVVVQETGWIDYAATVNLTLSTQGGAHFIQAWVADGAGNTSEMAQERINYQPEPGAVSAGQVHVYRVELTAGEMQHIAIETLTGDADLYVWDPDGSLAASSFTENVVDQVDFEARVSGVYQVEVYGYVDSTYTIDFDALAGSPVLSSALAAGLDKTPRSTPTILTENEPLNNVPAVAAPISAKPDTYLFFVPMVQKKLK